MGPLENRFEKEKGGFKTIVTARDRERLGFFVGLNEVHSAIVFVWRMSSFSNGFFERGRKLVWYFSKSYDRSRCQKGWATYGASVVMCFLGPRSWWNLEMSTVLERIGMDSWALVARTEKRKFFGAKVLVNFRCFVFVANCIWADR